ncbi:threonine ammonia-lyase [Mycobacterium kansasii]|nr:threonine ammonia-lyase [Mycobacterium kansasii]UCA20102.1 threonine ammonia-lyase [Mycobacterium kansasii]UGT80161.1 threonine ammonia-lyase [Mycobacterium kansasii]UGT84438.1 threonine ammonia-lyase [Mycobacterium kansasii]UGU27328.1 threonine ammonia-lyase [Mycobacterium kansasii]
MSPAVELLTLDQINAAAELLKPVVRPTPVVASRILSDSTGKQVWLKCENLQRTGSFKARGAYNRIANLSAADRARGVVAASAGNHAQGVAWAATELGIASTVFMPVTVALPKLAATKAYGAHVHLIGDTVDDALVAAREYAQQHDAVLIHPFDHPDVIAGQATVGLEILQQIPDVSTIVVPTGGGGLVAGIATAAHFLAPQARVIGVQAANAAAWPASLAAGHPVRLESMSTMADGIAVASPGAIPFAHVRAFVNSIQTVSEEALSRALLLCIERVKLIVEPAGAAAVAAVMTSAPEPDAHGPVCAVLSGGNMDPLVLTHVVTHGLRAAGRYLAIKVTIPDRPGGLSRLLAVVSATGASVLDVVHVRTARKLALDEVEVRLTLETRGAAHREEVLEALIGAGFVVCVEDA